MNVRSHVIASSAVLILALANAGLSQDASPPPPVTNDAAASELNVSENALSIGPQRVIDLLKGGDPAMWGLVLCSIMTVTFALERLIVLRSSRVIPRTFVTRFMDRLRDGELDRGKARELCRDNGSPIANLFAIVISHSGQSATEIRNAVAERGQAEMFHLRRRVRALNGLATLAPLLGLFGTVIGMIEAFHALSQQSGAGKTEMLARGISLALVATASGLCIAIIAAASYYYLLGRLDRIVQEMDLLVNEVVEQVAAGSPPIERPAPRPRIVPAHEQASG